jgi:hypothetical protein
MPLATASRPPVDTVGGSREACRAEISDALNDVLVGSGIARGHPDHDTVGDRLDDVEHRQLSPSRPRTAGVQWRECGLA